MYFKLFKLTNWRKITGEGRRQIVRYCPCLRGGAGYSHSTVAGGLEVIS